MPATRQRRSRPLLFGNSLPRKRPAGPASRLPPSTSMGQQDGQPAEPAQSLPPSSETSELDMDVSDEVLEKLAREIRLDLISPEQAKENEKRAHQVSRSFLSDTVTVPTPEMFHYAMQASLGDDVFDEPHTAQLEQHVARVAGKAAGLFVPSGTMSNQLAIRTHLTQPPHSVLLDIRAHVNKYEAGGVAYHNGAATITVTPSNGHHLTLEDVMANIVLGSEIHSAATRVVELENTLNGTIFPQDEIIRISEYVHANDVILHLDGARLWHVAAETGTSMRELCAPFDTVSLCLSKGLGAPIGSVLVGPEPFIRKARWLRKLFGGGMRQTGFMAGAAAYALSNNFERLAAVHTLARKLEARLKALGVKITSPAETCMVFWDATHLGISFREVIDRAAMLPDPIQLFGSRLVLHIQTSAQAVDDLVGVFAELIEEKNAAMPHENGIMQPKEETAAGAANGQASQYQDVFVREPMNNTNGSG